MVQVNVVSMWQFRDREGPEDTRVIIEPELITKSEVRSGVTDLCFLDERTLVASLENGGVTLLQYLTFTKVSKILNKVITTFGTCTLEDPLPIVHT